MPQGLRHAKDTTTHFTRLPSPVGKTTVLVAALAMHFVSGFYWSISWVVVTMLSSGIYFLLHWESIKGEAGGSEVWE